MNAPQTGGTNRTPWIIAGVLGCLVACLLLVVVAGGAYFFLFQGAGRSIAPPTLTRAALTVPTLEPAPTLAASPVAPTPAQRTPSPSSPLPTLAAPTATNTTSAAPTGKLAFTVRRGDRPEDQYIFSMNADGSGLKQILDRSSEPAFSPDGTKIAYYHWTDGIFVANVDGSQPTKILGDSVTGYLAWSPDGKQVALSARPAGRGNIFVDVVPADGSALRDPNARRGVAIGFSPAWKPDGTEIVFHTCRDNVCGIYKSSVQGGAAVVVVGDDGGLAAWSPDGTKILYQKDVDGQKQLFAINPDGSGKKQLTSGAAMHVAANWSLDGRFIFYRSPEGGAWGIWVMDADGSNQRKLADNLPPGDWPYDRITVAR